jgi:plasmid replication initiation protein
MPVDSPSGRQPITQDALEIFCALPGELAVRDLQDLMIYPWFALGKSKRTAPIQYQAGDLTLRVEGTREHGLATIWDADVLIWVASQIVEARDAGLPTSRFLSATPYEILKFIRRGTSARDYFRLRAAFDRLQSTTVVTSIRQAAARRRLHRFSWINEWKEQATHDGKPLGIQLVIPDWFYSGVLDAALVLTIDRAYFTLTGGIERWLYRLVRKHAGHQVGGWRFNLRHLHVKSGSLARFSDFALDVRQIVARQSLPGYQLTIEHQPNRVESLAFRPCPTRQVEASIRDLVRTLRVGDKP